MIKRVGRWLLYSWLLIASSSLAAEQCERLSASTNAEYPPYFWQTDTQPAKLKGAFVILLERLSASTGIMINPVYAGPWARTQVQAYNGSLDILGAFYTSSRDQWLDYLQPPLLTASSRVWINQAAPFVYNTMSDLKGRTGITVMNNSLGQEFDSYARQELELITVSSIEQGLLMLAEQRADYLVYEYAPTVAVIGKLQIKGLHALAPALAEEGLYLTMSKKSRCNTQPLRAKLSAALTQAKAEGWVEQALQQAQEQWANQQD